MVKGPLAPNPPSRVERAGQEKGKDVAFLAVENQQVHGTVLGTEQYSTTRAGHRADPGTEGFVWVDAENVPIRTMKVSRKRAKIGPRAGPIWHYVALGTPYM